MSEIPTRQILRARTCDALIAAGVANGNVAPSRVRPLRDDGPAAVLVYTTRESGTGTGPDGPPSFQTVIELIIDAVASTPDEDDAKDDEQELDDLLDDLADDILTATLESLEWLKGIEAISSLDIVKHPAGPDGRPVLGGLRVSMQVSIGTITYEPVIPTAFETLGAKPVTADGATRQFGVDINRDGAPDIEFEETLPQN